jgi:hypothetical protein
VLLRFALFCLFSPSFSVIVLSHPLSPSILRQINIWTEFIPCLLFLFGLIILESTDPVVFRATTPAWDRFFVMIGLLGGVVIRPLCSGLAHTFYPMSNRAFIIWSVDGLRSGEQSGGVFSGKAVFRLIF